MGPVIDAESPGLFDLRDVTIEFKMKQMTGQPWGRAYGIWSGVLGK
jgi:hypothetical protein